MMLFQENKETSDSPIRWTGERIAKKIATVLVVVGIYAILCVLFFKYSVLEDAHESLFICSSICFVLGFLGTVITTPFCYVLYKFIAWLFLKSDYDFMLVSEKKAYKGFIGMIIGFVIVSYILLTISIIISIV